MSPHNPLGYIDLATVYATLSTTLRNATSDWRQIGGRYTGTDVVRLNLSTGDYALDSLQRIFATNSDIFQEVQHWGELAERRAPQDTTFPYILVTIGRWPLDLTSADRLLAGRVDIEFYATRYE